MLPDSLFTHISGAPEKITICHLGAPIFQTNIISGTPVFKNKFIDIETLTENPIKYGTVSSKVKSKLLPLNSLCFYFIILLCIALELHVYVRKIN